MRRELFSIAIDEREYFNDEQAKIELVSCPRGSESCMEYLSVINNCFRESLDYHLNKDYSEAIDALKRAFEISKEIRKSSCQKCAGLFRSTITQSLENIYDDLKQMSTGWFRTNHFQSSYKLATFVLEEFRKEI